MSYLETGKYKSLQNTCWKFLSPSHEAWANILPKRSRKLLMLNIVWRTQKSVFDDSCCFSGLNGASSVHCPRVILSLDDSGLVHVTSLGQWDISKCDASGGVLHVCTFELVLLQHSFLSLASGAEWSQSMWWGHTQHCEEENWGSPVRLSIWAPRRQSALNASLAMNRLRH